MLKSEFSGDVMIFAKQYEGRTFYSLGLSKKKQDGSYENGYIDVQFKKGVNVPNKTKINITNGFLTFYNNKDKHTVTQIFVTEFESEAMENEPSYGVPEGFQALDDDDIPF